MELTDHEDFSNADILQNQDIDEFKSKLFVDLCIALSEKNELVTALNTSITDKDTLIDRLANEADRKIEELQQTAEMEKLKANQAQEEIARMSFLDAPSKMQGPSLTEKQVDDSDPFSFEPETSSPSGSEENPFNFGSGAETLPKIESDATAVMEKIEETSEDELAVPEKKSLFGKRKNKKAETVNNELVSEEKEAEKLEESMHQKPHFHKKFPVPVFVLICIVAIALLAFVAVSVAYSFMQGIDIMTAAKYLLSILF